MVPRIPLFPEESAMLRRLVTGLVLFAVTLFVCGCDSSGGTRDSSPTKPSNKSGGGGAG
jgi:hypothetical protein